MQPVAGHSPPSTALHPSPVSPSACVAVAGAGGFGQFCLEAYRQTGDISVAAVADPNLAGSAPRTHPELSVTADWRNLRTHGIMFFAHGYVEIDGWIPDRVHGRVDAPAAALEAVVRPLCPSLEVREDSGAICFDVRFRDRQAAYRSAIVDGMRDLIAKHRGPSHRMVVSAHDARDSLYLALGARRAVETGRRERLSR
jgi:hypothetical protein